MQLGFVTAILHDLPFDEVLAFAAGEGFATVEPMCWPVGRAERKYAGVTHIDVTDLTSDRADDVRARVERAGVQLSALGYYPNVLSDDEAHALPALAHLRAVIAAAPRLGVSTVTTFIGADHHEHPDDNFARFLEVWPDLVRLAEQHAVRIAIENCPMLFTRDEWPAGKNMAYSPAIWRKMFSAIPSSYFGLNYDPSHMIWQFMDHVAPIAEFKDRLFHVHAKDTAINRRKLNDTGILAQGWQTPVIPGRGEVDWEGFFDALQTAGYDGPVCIEVEDDTFGKTLDGRQRALRESRRALEGYF
ncbi:MAG: sugar phosphate isomerase/epimerase [Vicinamibacteria bacterium]|nr:sugar phosphate isomerase/epimerase [Vicinamibacteria bacterium]